MEVRFLHDPNKDYGYVGVSFSGNIVRFFPGKNGNYETEVVIEIKP